MPLSAIQDEVQLGLNLDFNVDLDARIQCQFGQQNVLADLKCLLDCTHEAHPPAMGCSVPATWQELMKCHPDRLFLCDGHAVVVQKGIDAGRRLAIAENEPLECFHCDGLFEVVFERI